MSKSLITLLITVLFISCTSDEAAPLNPLIGDWESVSVSLVLENGTTKEVPISECERQIYMSAPRRGGFILKISAFDEEYGGCYIHLHSVKSDWTQVSEDRYVVDIEYYLYNPNLEPGEDYEEGEATFPLDVSFPTDRLLYVYDQELFGFYPEAILEEDVVSFHIIYKKVGNGA